MTIQTFADGFTVRRQSAGLGGMMGGYGALSVTGQGNHISPGSQLFRPIEQVQHYRLWNYVAISRNSFAASKSVPNVSVVARGKPKADQFLSDKQRQFLSENYSGVLHGPQDDLEPLEDTHPLVSLLANPSPDDWWNSLAFESYMFYGLTGGIYWWVIPNSFGLPAEMYVIPTQWVTKVFSKTGELKYYRVNGNGRQMDLPPDQVIEALAKNPVDKTRPISPISAGAEWILNTESVEQSRQASLNQGPYPSVVLGFDPEIYGNAPEESLLTQVGEKFISRYGGTPNAGKPISLPPGITANPWSLKPAEMDFLNSGEATRDSVLALHGTPRAIAGLSHDLNRASIQGAHLIHCETVIIPLHCWVAGVLTKKLAPRYGQNLKVWFDDVRPRDDEQELAETQLDWAMGAVTPDERRQERGRPKMGTPGSQKTYVPIGLTPLEDFDAGTEERQVEAATDKKPKPKAAGGGESLGLQPSGRPECCSHSPVTQADKTHGRMESIARGFVQIHEAYEKAAQSSLKRMWSAVTDRALQIFDKHKGDASVPQANELVSKGDFRPIFNRAMSPVWQAACKAGVKFEEKVLGLQKPKQAAKEVELPATMQRAVSDYLKTRQDGVWQIVLKTTQESLASAIDNGVKSGESPDLIRKRVQSVLGTRKNEAETIARTEVTASLSYGQQALRDDKGISKKVWIDTVDKKTRSTHIVAGGQIVDNNKPFVVGGQKLMHPGDGSLGATAEEICNCRCCATGYVE